MYRLFKTLHGVVRFERMLWFGCTSLLFLVFSKDFPLLGSNFFYKSSDNFVFPTNDEGSPKIRLTTTHVARLKVSP